MLSLGDQILFDPLPRQLAFLEAIGSHDFVLYGGAAGGGKSKALRWALIQFLIELTGHGIKGPRVGLFCEDYPSLRDRHLAGLAFEVPAEVGVFKESVHELHLAGGGVLCFRNLDDPAKYLSSQFAAIAVDELTRNPQSIFDLLRMRMRWPGLERPKFLAASNPGGIGHEWVKRLWIDREFPKELASIADQFVYIPAKASDNPHLPSSYYEALKTLPENLARAYAEGDWNIFAGQVFTEFRREIHVIESVDIPAWWRKWGSNDPGYADPGTWYAHAAGPDGQVYTFREWTFDQRLAYSEQAKAVKRSLDEDGIKIEKWVTGMDAFNPNPETGKSIADVCAAVTGWLFVEPDHGSGARKRMAGIVHEYLRPYPKPDVLVTRTPDGSTHFQGDMTARWQITSNCKKLISTLPTLPADENKPEQVAECDSDHWYQGAGYGLVDWHINKSTMPAEPEYKRGTAGHILGHAAKISDGQKKKGVFT